MKVIHCRIDGSEIVVTITVGGGCSLPAPREV